MAISLLVVVMLPLLWFVPGVVLMLVIIAPVSALATENENSEMPLQQQQPEEENKDTNKKNEDDDKNVDIEALLDTLGWDGQLGQMVQIDVQQLLMEDPDHPPPQKIVNMTLAQKWIGEYGIGSVFNGNAGWSAHEYRQVVRIFQTIAQQYGRPPVLWGLDSIHGANYVYRDAVLTPQPINLAATFNTTVSTVAGRLASYDTRRAGIPWLFSPLLGLSWKSGYWSRFYETFGEDPIVVGRMAQSMIQGIQQQHDDDVAVPVPSSSSSSSSQLPPLLPSRAAACGKHWIGYSNPQNGHDRSPSWIPKRHLYQYFLLPWKYVLLPPSSSSSSSSSNDNKDDDTSKLMTVMESYTEFDGVPNVANRFSLNHILRHQLNFTDGMLVTDYDEVYNLHNWHHIVPNDQEAILTVLQEGSVDMTMFGTNSYDQETFFATMKPLLNTYLRTNDDETTTNHNSDQHDRLQQRVRQSARRILELKQKLNMFTESFQLQPLPKDEDSTARRKQKLQQDIQTVLEMTQQAMVLVKNQDQTLPLVSPPSRDSSAGKAQKSHNNNNKKKKVLITGPTSDSLSFTSGGWTGEWQGINSNTEQDWFWYGSTVLDAMKKEEQDDNMLEITYECGVDILGNDCNNDNDSYGSDDDDDDEKKKDQHVLDKVKKWVHWGNGDTSSSSSSSNNNNSFDTIIICLGEENYAEKPGDIRNLELPYGQYALVRAIKETITNNNSASADTKIVLIYFGGRPRLLRQIEPLVDAIIIGFLPGPLAGNVIADFMTGRVNPNGKLPITYPKYGDLSGVPYLHSVSDMCTKGEQGKTTLPHYEYIPCDVQWPFGHGLSYTEFTYSNLSLSTTTLYQRWHDDNENGDDNLKDEELIVTVTVTNTGSVDGSESVLFFTFDEFRSTTPEYKRLRGFEKVFLSAGESKDVALRINLEDDLRFVGPHDDTHYILQDGLVFRFGITSNADCRNNNNDNDNDDSLCSDPIMIHTKKDYVGACEAACNLWKSSGCDSTIFLQEQNQQLSSSSLPSPSKKCRDACVSSSKSNNNNAGIQWNNDGWGWTYVSCIEEILWNDQFDSANDCWKLTTFCRNIQLTARFDELRNNVGSGHGSHPNGYDTNHIGDNITATQPPATIVAIIVGILASIMINCIMVRTRGDGRSNGADSLIRRRRPFLQREMRQHHNESGIVNDDDGNTNDYGEVQFTPIRSNEVC